MNQPIPEDLEYHPNACEEEDQIRSWYREQSPRTALEFETALDRVEDDLLRDPYAYLSHIHGTRRHKVGKFPYWVVYLILPEMILIVAISHEKRHPEYWVERLEDEDSNQDED